MKKLILLFIVAAAISACTDGSTSSHDTGCVQYGDTTTTCDGQEFKLYY